MDHEQIQDIFVASQVLLKKQEELTNKIKSYIPTTQSLPEATISETHRNLAQSTPQRSTSSSGISNEPSYKSTLRVVIETPQSRIMTIEDNGPQQQENQNGTVNKSLNTLQERETANERLDPIPIDNEMEWEPSD